jgi:HPt (histidine-containing phosphotransfer) domain-containing protein
MMDGLRARFMPRFVATARERLRRAAEMCKARDAVGVASELHACAGEAGMLELAELARLSAAGEIAARAWSTGGGQTAQDDCARCIAAIEEELLKVEQRTEVAP